MAFQAFIKLAESRNTPMQGPYAFASAEDRDEFVRGRTVYWYHLAEDDDWFSWKRGGAWAATATPGPADRVPEKPEITEEDRW
jgi:hypothetical protein